MRKVLNELHGRIDTGVIIWITNITGKIDCIFSAFLRPIPGSIVIGPSSLFPRDIQIDVISMYFIFARTFDLVRSFLYLFFFFFFVVTDLSHFLISNDLRLAKSLQICLHYVLKFKRPLEIYEAFTH